MNDSYYDVAQICKNGHVINSSAKDYPTRNQKFCEDCGQLTIMNCPSCQSPIRGQYHVTGVIGAFDYFAPSFCHDCGKPFPWTEAALSAAKELVAEIEGLSDDERATLGGTFSDLINDTPFTPVAETRYKKIMRKVGKESYDAMRSILTDIVSETVKKTIFGN